MAVKSSVKPTAHQSTTLERAGATGEKLSAADFTELSALGYVEGTAERFRLTPLGFHALND